MKRWLVFDVGCIECGESSSLVGLYRTEQEAKEIARSYEHQDGTKWGREEWTDQHSVEIFEVEVPE